MNFLAPIAFWGALLALPIILLYMLRLRRREVTVSSTYLWSQVLQDREVNTPWQRLRRNLLLLLQLLLLALLVLALARPFVTVPAVSARQVTLLLDASASMNATDMDGGETRFEAARREALDIVDTLADGDRVTVIRVGAVPEVLIPASPDRAQIRAALRGAEAGLAPADWQAALSLAAGSGDADDHTIVIISDGGLPDDAGLPGVDADVRYIPVGLASDNVAIAALATRALPGQPPQLYARLTNYGPSEARVVLTLHVDGERFAAENQVIPANSSLPIVSSALPANFETLRATLTQSVNAIAPDYLALDDAAYAVAGETRPRRVLLMTSGNLFLEQALRSLPGLEVVRATGDVSLPPNYDLYILENRLPDVLPDGDLFLINPPDSLPGLFALGDERRDTASPTAADDPRMAFVDVRGLSVLRFREVSNVAWAEPLLSVAGGPLLLAGTVEGRQVALMPFNVLESDLPLQIAWPVLLANLVEWFAPPSAIDGGSSLNVGEPLLIRPPLEADAVRVHLPDGETRTLPVERETVVFAGTDAPGIYRLEVLAGSRVLLEQFFAVNLFSSLESNIAPVPLDALQIEGATISAADAGEALGQRELWPLVILLALALLLIEWIAYHRRMRPPSAKRSAAPRGAGRLAGARS